MDFEAELAKFQPSLDIEQAEDAIYGNKTTDVTDLIQSILNNKVPDNGAIDNKSIEWVEES
ncbi:MAG TPA: hypothetical protein DCZ23_05335 [Lachnospiraceae bacterium]|nr:hypothetical protein [Lachnospiraceae bacterium]